MMETYRGMVYPSELDHIGHMNVQWYVCKFDQASWQLLSTVGLGPLQLRRQGKGMAAVQQNLQYKAEAGQGDLLVVRSKLLAISNKTVSFYHQMFNAETEVELADCEIVAAHIDLQRRKAEPLPEPIRKACLAVLNAS